MNNQNKSKNKLPIYNPLDQLTQSDVCGDEDEEENEHGHEEDSSEEDQDGSVKITEDDLKNLKDISTTIDTQEMLKEFFLAVTKKDHEYFSFCVKNMPNQSVKLMNKYMNF